MPRAVVAIVAASATAVVDAVVGAAIAGGAVEPEIGVVEDDEMEDEVDEEDDLLLVCAEEGAVHTAGHSLEDDEVLAGAHGCPRLLGLQIHHRLVKDKVFTVLRDLHTSVAWR